MQSPRHPHGGGGSVPPARILDHRALTGAGSVTDIITIALPSGMILHNCMVVEKDGKRWVSPPDRLRSRGGEIQKKSDGRPIYEKVVSFADRARADAFSAMALAALEEHLIEVAHG